VYLFLFLTTTAIAQRQPYEYLGVIKLSDSAFISYRIVFNEADGNITGYSLTDLGGPHETKSYISGYFDEQADQLDFYESSILYTKSPITQNDFCFVHFSGELKKLNERQRIQGSFKGLFSDGQQCIDGEIDLMNLSRILKRAEKIDRKIDRAVVIPKEQREKVNLVRELDSLTTNVIRKDERVNVFAKCNSVRFTYYDAGREDGDRISLYVNGNPLLRDQLVSAGQKMIEIPLSGKQTLVRIVAESTGSEGANTVKLDLRCNDELIETLTNLQAGEQAEFNFIVN
jgi:hypothetical protein